MTAEFEEFADGFVFGEGMRWHQGRLWMSDMLGRKVYTFDEAGNRNVAAVVPGRPNGIGFLPDGSLLVTSMEDTSLYRVEADGSLVKHADLSALMTGYCGDMAISAKGNAYVDDVGFRVFEGAAAAPGRLVLVRPDGSSRVVDDQLQFPNGMWITQDQSRLIFAEGRRNTLWQYDIGEDGDLSNKRLFAELPDLIDAITLDAEGAAWLCNPYAGQVLRIREGGEVIGRLTFDGIKPVSLCLGGADLRTLFVVAADYTLERMARNDTSAIVYRTRVETPGFPLP